MPEMQKRPRRVHETGSGTVRSVFEHLAELLRGELAEGQENLTCGRPGGIVYFPPEKVSVECGLPAGHSGAHYDDAFSYEWRS